MVNSYRPACFAHCLLRFTRPASQRGAQNKEYTIMQSPYVIETKRLLLRKFQAKDAASLYLLNSDPEVLRYTGDQPFVDEGEALEFIQNYSAYQDQKVGRWAVLAKIDQRFLGWAGLKLHSDGMIDIGFRFLRKEWGQGFATEAAKACLQYGFQELHLTEVLGRVLPNNKASIHILKKLGMQFWKEGRCDGWEGANYYRINKADK